MRNFLWGGSDDKGKTPHKLVDRHNGKRNGGLGIKAMHSMNQAFMAKLGWRSTMEQENLWAKVIISKYVRGDIDI